MKKAPIHEIIETPAFTKKVKDIGLSSAELAAVYDLYAADPSYGKVLRNTGGLRKGRAAKDGSGKSGGYRVFSFYSTEHCPVYLLWIIDKSEDATLTDAQEKGFKRLTGALKAELRK
ncbi:MAG: type II toxin-antitoxin system RelE/ParE family toxin [Pseudomonadota bacterium]|nr:type II toxin-antitoxin system RelE/ParE family toxin [Pseudomonadota bacterium]